MMRLTAFDPGRCLGAALLACAWLGTAGAAQGVVAAPASDDGMPPFETALAAQAERLSRLGDDASALDFYRESLAGLLEVPDTVRLLSAPARRSRTATPPPDLEGPALSLVKALVHWETALSLRAAAERRDLSALAAIPDREAPRRDWLAGEPAAPALDRALRLARVVASLAAPEPATAPTPEERARDAAIDRRYPTLAEGDDSWIEVAVRDGLPGVLRRLGRGDERAEAAASPPAAAVRYFHSRLGPVFLAQIVAETIRAESDARRRAATQWTRLATWRETWSTERGLARLCGTWQWVVHNHQNHQDHKMVVTFPPPGAERSGPALPKRIVVLGDSVYLRWEFPGGVQEDSLLFSGRDRRLEGTFVNSQGPYGAITGRLVRPCGATP